MHEWTFDELDALVGELADRTSTHARRGGVRGNFTGILTGSFASFKHAQGRGETTDHKPRTTHPDVNLYFFISDEDDRMAALDAHGDAITEFRASGRERSLQVLVDSHPFVTPSYPDDFSRDDLPLVQFTTLVLSVEDLAHHLPTVCRESWATHYHLLFGEDVLAPYRGRPIARNEGWVASKLRGIVDYLGVLNRLQFGISCGSSRVESIFHQSLLYLWEIIKEGIPAALDDAEFDRGDELKIRQGKRRLLAPFFEQRYGTIGRATSSAREIVEYALVLDDEYHRHRHDLEAARRAIGYALVLGKEVHARFTRLYHRKLDHDAVKMQAAMAEYMAWY